MYGSLCNELVQLRRIGGRGHHSIIVNNARLGCGDTLSKWFVAAAAAGVGVGGEAFSCPLLEAIRVQGHFHCYMNIPSLAPRCEKGKLHAGHN